MSQQQVEAILGSPTSVEIVSSWRTLFYKGYASGSFLVGKVTLYDGQLSYTKSPAFPPFGTFDTSFPPCPK